MKRKTHALAAGIIPFIAAVPMPVAAKSAQGLTQLGMDRVSIASTRAIAGFPELPAPTPTMLAKDTKPTKPTKCPPSPSKPTKKCK
jgi:hypothetical protein